MANGREAAEKAYRLAEERFLAGDLDAALRLSRNAKRHFASLPALERALAAYEVHAAARGGGRSRDWQAVLGVRPPATRDAIKKQYKRMSCLVLHPVKNRSAAADGAFKLLQQAWEALSSAPPPPGGGHTPPPPDERDWWWWWSYGSRYAPPPHDEPDAPPFDFGAWREAYARDHGNIYCGRCYSGGAKSSADGQQPRPQAEARALLTTHRRGSGNVVAAGNSRAPRCARCAVRGSRRRWASGCVP
ncbi:hypothetical protein BS78_01G018400 [Paspalum vaginatum]|nr:hypothetical protein BS78_01G018400 [Paspalum vaginatum]